MPRFEISNKNPNARILDLNPLGRIASVGEIYSTGPWAVPRPSKSIIRLIVNLFIIFLGI